jgi:RNA polymerase sigma-70 factor (ECF subfamily)
MMAKSVEPSDDHVPAARSLEDPGPESLEAIKSYLDYRSRGVEPPPPLVRAWEGFYDFYAPRVAAFLQRWSLSEADRNDCVQDVWHEVIARLAYFRRDTSRARLSTWMMTLARNKAVDVIRRRARRPSESLDHGQHISPTDPCPDPAVEYERRRVRAEVRGALDELSRVVSPTSFRVLYLRYIEDRPTTEVAAVLALTPEQVRFRTCRMRRKVRDLLERSMGHQIESDCTDIHEFRVDGHLRNKASHPASNRRTDDESNR